jgi:hypothetical protein
MIALSRSSASWPVMAKIIVAASLRTKKLRYMASFGQARGHATADWRDCWYGLVD